MKARDCERIIFNYAFVMRNHISTIDDVLPYKKKLVALFPSVFSKAKKSLPDKFNIEESQDTRRVIKCADAVRRGKHILRLPMP